MAGASIYSAAPEAPKAYMVRVGLLAERAALPPQRQIWRRSAVPWCEDISEVESFPDQGGAPV